MAKAQLCMVSAPLGMGDSSAAPAILTLEQDGKTVYAIAHGDTASALELGAWIDLPEDKHFDLSGGALVRLRF